MMYGRSKTLRNERNGRFAIYAYVLGALIKPR